MDAQTKPIQWLGSSLDDPRAFPIDARKEAGRESMRVPFGRMPTDWKPMVGVGHGVHEIRIHTGLEHRVFCLAKFAEAIFVRHAFEKRTRKTNAGDIDLAKHRLTELIRRRAGR